MPTGDATVTISHRYTPKDQLRHHTQIADIVIAAAGVTKLPPCCVKPHCVNGMNILSVFFVVVFCSYFASGIPNLITADMIKEGAAVIDVGINRVQDPVTGKSRLVGDVDFEGNLKKKNETQTKKILPPPPPKIFASTHKKELNDSVIGRRLVNILAIQGNLERHRP